MNHIKLATSTIVLFLAISVLSALPATDNDRSINDLYENLLQREYTGPISLSEHQVERKAVRSPSLRLRFGRRSDPDMAAIVKRYSDDDEVSQKPIRSPSLRLRFGRSGGAPSNENRDTYEPLEQNWLAMIKRAPSMRMRWGRNTGGSEQNNLNDAIDSLGIPNWNYDSRYIF